MGERERFAEGLGERERERFAEDLGERERERFAEGLGERLRLTVTVIRGRFRADLGVRLTTTMVCLCIKQYLFRNLLKCQTKNLKV